uniref:Uncharacterized protein n=1 Tax=Glossina pallidipes TaxID=7398 RepID=A0A1B0AA83_GLOPL
MYWNKGNMKIAQVFSKSLKSFKEGLQSLIKLNSNFWNVNARNSCGVKDNSKLRSKVCLISTAISESMPISESVVPNERDLRSRAPKIAQHTAISSSGAVNNLSAKTALNLISLRKQLIPSLVSFAMSNFPISRKFPLNPKQRTEANNLSSDSEFKTKSTPLPLVSRTIIRSNEVSREFPIRPINSASRGFPSIEFKITLTDSSVRPAQLILGAIFPVSKAKQTLTSEHIPEAGSAWPAFDLTEPTNKGVER